MQTKSFALVPAARPLREARAEHELILAFENKEDAFSRSSPFYASSPAFSGIHSWNIIVRTVKKGNRDALDVFIVTMDDSGSEDRRGIFKTSTSLSVNGIELGRSDPYMHCYTITKSALGDAWDGKLVVVATVLENEVQAPVRDVKPVWRPAEGDDEGSAVECT